MRREMPPPPLKNSRINLRDLQSQMAAKIGPERAQRYFSHLSRFLVQKVRKAEFDALCLEILGLENVGLHNRFLRSILWNASQAKLLSPSLHGRDSLKLNKAPVKKSPSASDFLHHSPFPASANGDFLPPSPRRSRSTIYRPKDHQPSHLRLNGKVNATAAAAAAAAAAVGGGGAEAAAKKQRVEKPSSQDPAEAAFLEDAESDRGPIVAPLGIPFFRTSLGGSRSTATFIGGGGGGGGGGFSSGELRDTEALRNRMEQIAAARGLGAVTMDCANLLNNGLDAYLKRILTSCVDLVGARSGQEPANRRAFRQQSHGKMVNGVSPENNLHLLRASGSSNTRRPLSMLDLRVAMEMNPLQLGEDWPSLLEKTCVRSVQE